MPGMMENLQTLNSIVRTVVALVVVGGIGAAGYYGYRTYTSAERSSAQKDQQLQEAEQALAAKDQQLAVSRQELEQRQQELAEKDQLITKQTATITELNQDLEQKKAEIQRLETALRLHKMERRLARVSVLDVETDPQTKKTYAQIEFLELTPEGEPVGEARRFRIEGELVYVDYWVVKFEDKYVENADLERGTSICLFNRIFGEFQKPTEGFCLDEPGRRPGPYARGSVMSEFEKKIWDDFWQIANTPQQAAELGIRALHGDAVSIKVKKGKTYRIMVRASGGPEIEVGENGAPPPPTSGAGWDLWQPPRHAWPTWVPVRQSPSASGPHDDRSPRIAGSK